jgi:hypothetical protein
VFGWLICNVIKLLQVSNTVTGEQLLALFLIELVVGW